MSYKREVEVNLWKSYRSRSEISPNFLSLTAGKKLEALCLISKADPYISKDNMPWHR